MFWLTTAPETFQKQIGQLQKKTRLQLSHSQITQLAQ
jgi:hypothetical protein